MIKGLETTVDSLWQTLGWNLDENSKFVQNAHKEMANHENTLLYSEIPIDSDIW